VFESDLCYGFLLGFLTAGFFGFIFQRLVLLRRTASRAGKRETLVETKQSAREVYMSSMRARTEMMIWIFMLVLLVIAVAWIYIS
jgi:ABC-type lipoprotein release transport system permease subunit